MPDFDEGNIERDEQGRFASKGGGAGAGVEKKAERVAGAVKQFAERHVGAQTRTLARLASGMKSRAERREALKKYVAEEVPKPPKGAPWKGDSDKPDAETWEKFFEGGPPGDTNATVKDPQRAELHEAITEHFIGKAKSVPENENPVAVMMMGAPASGKSSMVKGLDISSFAKIDPDGIKEKLPEYRDGVAQKHRPAAMNVHEESSWLAKKIRDQAISERKNILFDGTGRNQKGYADVIKKLKEKGYKVKLMMADVPKEVGKARALARAEHTGRWVKPDVVDDAYAHIPRNFGPLSKMADSFQLYDNSGKESRLVWSNQAAHDPQFVSEFTRKWGAGGQTLRFGDLPLGG